MIADTILILSLIDDSIDFMETDMVDVQKKLEEYLIESLLLFEITKGKFVSGQKYSDEINKIEKGMNKILEGKKYTGAIEQYLNELDDIQDANVKLQKKYNDLEVEVSKLSPARKFVYEQANHYLTGKGLDEQYVQPIKYLLMQQVTSGASITESKKMIHKWATGELTDGELTMGRQTPNLQKYSTQIARDTSFQFNGVINQIIAEEYDLDKFIYVGNLVKDSRPLCKHLVDLDRPIDFDELPPLIKKYPTGLYKGTTKDNFVVYRGGYNCRHTVVPIKE